MLSVSVCILLKINVHALYEYVLCGYCVFLLQVVHKLREPMGVLHRKCSPMFMTSSSIPISQEHHDSTVMLHPYSISHRIVNLLQWSRVTLLCQWHCTTNGDEWWNGTLKEETSPCLMSWRDEFVTLTANKYWFLFTHAHTTSVLSFYNDAHNPPLHKIMQMYVLLNFHL